MAENTESSSGTNPTSNAAPAHGHQLERFPAALVILLHYLTCGIFSLVWLNVMHGRLPRVRPDDPSAGRAVGFCFIPFFNLYWIFFSYRRLCLRVDEQRELYGLAPNGLRGMATTACIFQVIPYINILLGYTIIFPVFAALMQSSINQLVAKSATTPPRATLATVAAAPGMPGWAIALVVCGCCVIPCLIGLMAALLLPALAKAKQKAERIVCVNHLKQIGVAFRISESDNGDLPPFDVSTNKGGTLEFRSPGPDGFDKNSWLHFQALSNELGNSTKILVCPADSGKELASDFSHLRSNNVSYLIYSATNAGTAYPQTVLAICPVHHNVLLGDGSVQQVTEAQLRQLMQPAK
jgi:hypothetical protein